jgi:hypothetical protein
MRFGYGIMHTSINSFSRRVLLALALCVLPAFAWMESHASGSAEPVAKKQVPPPPVVPKPDPRIARLVHYFSKLNCPVLNLSHVFVKAADENRLDWRLLPSISVIESGGGKAYRNNNIFGWDGGAQFFPSISSGIELVAAKLGHSPLYRNRDVVGKLRVYNPNESYVQQVLTVMNRISPVADIPGTHSPVLSQRN